MTTQGKFGGVAQQNLVKVASPKPFMTGTVIDYTDMAKNTPSKIVWGELATCDAGLWKTASDCLGVDKPWGSVYLTPEAQLLGATKHQMRVWHYLGDEGADRNKVFAIEKGDYLNVLFYEYVDKSQGSASAGSAWGNAEEYRWDVKQVQVASASWLQQVGPITTLLALYSSFF